MRALLAAGTRHRCRAIELFRVRATGDRSRAGIVVPRYGNTIVRRNRLKRHLRECVRTMWLPTAGVGEAAEDMLIRARPAAYDLDFEEIREAFRRCTETAT